MDMHSGTFSADWNEEECSAERVDERVRPFVQNLDMMEWMIDRRVKALGNRKEKYLNTGNDSLF